MDLTPSQIEQIESMIEKLENLDPAQLPAPAAELVDLLSTILESPDGDD